MRTLLISLACLVLVSGCAAQNRVVTCEEQEQKYTEALGERVGGYKDLCVARTETVDTHWGTSRGYDSGWCWVGNAASVAVGVLGKDPYSMALNMQGCE